MPKSILTKQEKSRLESAIKAAWADPFLGDIGDDIWESIFHFIKGLPIPDVIKSGKSKCLFDAVDNTTKKGWSLKALQTKHLSSQDKFECVIQRADIFKKSISLGFPEKLSMESAEETLGKALIKHWNDKIIKDKKDQGVICGRLGVLLKIVDRREYAYIERPLPVLEYDDLKWSWTNLNQAGLQAIRKSDKKLIMKWYPSQKQLFQCLTVPDNATRLQMEPERIEANKFVDNMLEALPGKKRDIE